MKQQKNTSRRREGGTRTQKEIKRLRLALDKERRKNARLKRQITALKGAYGQSPGEQELRWFKGRRKGGDRDREQAELLRAGEVNARRFSKSTYLAYLTQTVKESTVGMIFSRIALYVRRLRLVRTIVAVLSTVTVALLLSAFFLTALPFLILLSLGTLLVIFLRAQAANRRMRRALAGCERVRVMILPEQITFSEDTFAEGSAKDMARERGTAVLAVTPRLWSAKGLGGKGMFFTARREASDLYLIRRGYYFILRRRVLDHLDTDVTVIY